MAVNWDEFELASEPAASPVSEVDWDAFELVPQPDFTIESPKLSAEANLAEALRQPVTDLKPWEGGVVRSPFPGSLQPEDLRPAIRLIGGELVEGDKGDTHPDIIKDEKIPAVEIDQRGFMGPQGEFYDREGAAQGLDRPTAFEPGRLHSTDLSAFQKGVDPAAQLQKIAEEEVAPPLQLPTAPGIKEVPMTWYESKAYAPTTYLFGQEAANIEAQVARELYNSAKSVPEFFSTEEGMLAALASIHPLGKLGVTAYFAQDMAKAWFDEATKLGGDWDKLEPLDKAKRLTQAFAKLGFAALLTRGVIKEAKPIVAPLFPKEIDPRTGEPLAPETIRYQQDQKPLGPRKPPGLPISAPPILPPPAQRPADQLLREAPAPTAQEFAEPVVRPEEVGTRQAPAPMTAPLPESAVQRAPAPSTGMGEFDTGRPFVPAERALPTSAEGFVGRPMEADAIWNWLDKRHGIKPGGAVEVVDTFGDKSSAAAEVKWSAKVDENGVALRDMNGNLIPDKPIGIRINRSRMYNENVLNEFYDHELGHWADLEKPDLVAKVFEATTEAERLKIDAEVAKLKYPGSERAAEFNARLIHKLAKDWRGRPWFDKLASEIKLFLADTVGIKASDKTLRARAEKVAVRAIGWSAKRVKEAAGLKEAAAAPAFAARVDTDKADRIILPFKAAEHPAMSAMPKEKFSERGWDRAKKYLSALEGRDYADPKTWVDLWHSLAQEPAFAFNTLTLPISRQLRERAGEFPAISRAINEAHQSVVKHLEELQATTKAGGDKALQRYINESNASQALPEIVRDAQKAAVGEAYMGGAKPIGEATAAAAPRMDPPEVQQAKSIIADYQGGRLSAKDYGAYRRAIDVVSKYNAQRQTEPPPGSLYRPPTGEYSMLVKVEQKVAVDQYGRTQQRTYEVSFDPALAAKKADGMTAVPLRSPAQARKLNASPTRIADWQKIFAKALPIKAWRSAMKITEKGKLKDVPVVSLTKGCQRSRTMVERVQNGLLPAETRIEACYGGDCWANKVWIRLFKNFENMEVRDLEIADSASIAKWLSDPKNVKWLNSSSFIRMGQQGCDSHAIATGAVEAWLKQARAAGVKKKTILISAGYAPVTDAQYAALRPYANDFELHFSVSGWFHKNELMLRLGEFEAARKQGLPASLRVITNKDGVRGLTMENEAFLERELAKMGVKQEEILETPFHDDVTKERSEASGKYKYICCENDVCAKCKFKCMTKVPAAASKATSEQLADVPTGKFEARVSETKEPWEQSVKEISRGSEYGHIEGSDAINAPGRVGEVIKFEKRKDAPLYRLDRLRIDDSRIRYGEMSPGGRVGSLDGFRDADVKRAEAYSRLQTETPPIFLIPEKGNILYIEDGHHRIEGARMAGKKTIDAWVMMVDRNGNPVTHKQLVAQAIRDGRPVPPDVLADYPGMAPKGGAGTFEAKAPSPEETGFEEPRLYSREEQIKTETEAYRKRQLFDRATQQPRLPNEEEVARYVEEWIKPMARDIWLVPKKGEGRETAARFDTKREAEKYYRQGGQEPHLAEEARPGKKRGKITWVETDSGLWEVWDEGVSLGYIWDQGSKTAGEKVTGYDILEDWHDAGERRVSRAKTFPEAVAKLRKARQIADSMVEAVTGEKPPKIVEDSNFEPPFWYGSGKFYEGQIYHVAGTGLADGVRWVKLKTSLGGRDYRWVKASELKAEKPPTGRFQAIAEEEDPAWRAGIAKLNEQVSTVPHYHAYSINMPRFGNVRFLLPNKISAKRASENVREGEEITTLGDLFSDLIREHGKKASEMGQGPMRATYGKGDVSQQRPNLKNPQLIFEPEGYSFDEADLMAHIEGAYKLGYDGIILVSDDAVSTPALAKLRKRLENWEKMPQDVYEKLDEQRQDMIVEAVQNDPKSVNLQHKDNAVIVFEEPGAERVEVPETVADIKTLTADEILDMERAGKITKQRRDELLTGTFQARATPPVEPLGEAARDLTEKLKTVPAVGTRERLSIREQLAEKWSQGKTLMQRASASAQAVTEGLKDAARGVQKMNDVEKRVGELDWLLQRAAGQSRDLGRVMMKQIPNADLRRAVAIYMDSPGNPLEKIKAIEDTIADIQANPAIWARTTPKVRRALEMAANLPPEGLALADQLKDYFARREQDAINYNLFENGLPDYFTHIWGRESNMPNAMRGAIGSDRVNAYWQFSKRRTLGSFLDGIREGKTPELDAAKVLPFYNYTLDRAVASRHFVKEVTDNLVADDGRAVLAPSGTVNKAGPPGGTPTASIVRPRGRTDAIADYRAVNHPAMRKWKWLVNDENGNPVLSLNDLLVHPDYYERIARMMDQTRLRGTRVGRALIRASTEVKGFKLGLLSAFHQVHVGSHAIFHWTKPFDFRDPKYFTPDGHIRWESPDVRFAIEQGHLKIGPDPREMQMFAEGLLSPGLVHKIPVLGPWSRAYSEFTFGEYIPKLKLKTFSNALERNRRWFRGKLTDEEIAARVGDSVNNAFGELNSLWLGKVGRDPGFQRLLRAIFLAPDFGEARLRFVGKALTSFGTEERLALATMFLTLYSGARFANWLSHGDPETDPKRAFQVKVGKHWWSMRSVVGDLDRLFLDTGRFLYVRLNPLYSRTAADWLFGRDISGKKLTPMEKLVTRPAQQLVPIQFGALTRDDQAFWESFIGSMGLSAIPDTPQQDVYRMVDKWMRTSGDPKLELAAKRKEGTVFAQSDYAKLRYALAHDNMAEAQVQYNELRKVKKAEDIFNAMMWNTPFSGSWKSEPKFKKTLTPDQLKIYQQAVADRKEMFERFKKLDRWAKIPAAQ